MGNNTALIAMVFVRIENSHIEKEEKHEKVIDYWV